MKSFSESYKAAGVDVTAGYKAVELMKTHVSRTKIPGVLSGIGTNINQLAHWVNGKGYVTQAQIHDAARFAREAWELVRESI